MGEVAIKAILQNPRYTGHETWAKQRRDEVLLDAHNVALDHTSKLRWNDEAGWIHGPEPTHTALISTDLYEHAQDIIASASRPTTGNRRTPNPYLLKGMVPCSICHRKMQGNQLRCDLHYRCFVKNDYPAAEIRDLVERMHGIVAILQSASTEDRRRFYQAAQLSIIYDYQAKNERLASSSNNQRP